MNRIKSIKDLKELPSGNFLNIKTRIVYGKVAIEKEFGEELKELEKSKEAAKSKAEKSKAEKPKAEKPKAEVETKAKTKNKNKVKNGK